MDLLVSSVLFSLLFFYQHVQTFAFKTTQVPNCTFYQDKSSVDTSRLTPILGETVLLKTDESVVNYQYSIGICVSGRSDLYPNAGVVQSIIQPGHTTRDVQVGLYSKALFWQGSNWLMLKYEGGEHYQSHCNQEARSAIIVILCKKGLKELKMRVIEENRDKKEDCGYIFEAEHDCACAEPVPSTSGLSIGSVFLIIFFSLAGAYLIGGFLYQRLVVGASGFRLIPNYNIWKKVGEYSSDGCDVVFRCGLRSTDVHQSAGDFSALPQEDDEDPPLFT